MGLVAMFRYRSSRQNPCKPAAGAVVVLAAAVLVFVAGGARSQEEKTPEDQFGPVFTLSLGGKLYDDVWAILDMPPPEGRNPAYPDASAPGGRTHRLVLVAHPLPQKSKETAV